jgi:tetratricopeptide (TPR) repeat protein
MATWLSRTIKRLSGTDEVAPAQPPWQANPREVVDSAKQLIADRRYTEALAILTPVVDSNPNDADALAHVGVATHRAGASAEARKTLKRALQIDPNHLIAYKGLVQACYALGEYEEVKSAALNAQRLAPTDHEPLIMYGIACMHRFEIEPAADAFSKAVELAPNDLNALLNIEALSMRSLRHRRTLERSPKIAAARSHAINRLRGAYQRGDLDESGLRSLLTLLAGGQETFSGAVELAREISGREDFGSEISTQLGTIFYIAGDLSNLLRFRRRACEAKPSLPIAPAFLAYAELMAGAEHWSANWKTIQESEPYLGLYASEVPRWTGQHLGDKRILVYAEQGIGDAILALRLVPILAQRGVRFDLWVPAPLAGLTASVKGYENLIRTAQRPDARKLGCDYASTLFGLIPALRVGHEELKHNPTRLAPGKDRLPEVRSRLLALPGKRIGLVHGGNPDRLDDWFRAVPPAAMERLAALPGISWVNLSIDRRPDKDEVIRMFRMEDPMKEVADFEDTAAIISELDAVVAVDSSVAHLSASLGKPVWVLVPPLLAWHWQMGSDTRPWWPNATLMRGGPTPGQWNAVMERLAEELHRNGH